MNNKKTKEATNIIENNNVTVTGIISSELTYSHKVFGKCFYSCTLKCRRLSNTYDYIKVIIPKKLLVALPTINSLVTIKGEYRSFNEKNESGNSKLVLYLFAHEITLLDDSCDDTTNNIVQLTGYICKKPIYRKTPFGKNISDILLAVHRPYSKSDYIPCIAWGRNAAYVSTLDVGTKIQLIGRIQSREYTKKYDDGTSKICTAYEVSVKQVNVVE